MNLTSLASSALETTRSTFKGLAEAAVATGDNAATDTSARAGRAEKPAPKAPAEPAAKAGGRADSGEARPKGVRRGTLLDAYA
jgi:hypothetical protein